MAIGRQDYQAGVVPIKSGYSLTQTPFFKYETFPVVAGTSHNFCEYTVVAGYQLMVCGYRINSLIPFIQLYRLKVGGTSQLQNLFDTSVLDNFPENSPLKVAAGEEVLIQIFNEDTVTHIMYVTIFGYLEQIES